MSSSSTDVSRSLNYISSDSEEDHAALTFKVRMYHDYKQTAWLPNQQGLDATAGWILITTPHNRTYKIQVKENGETLLLQRGWSLLAAIENLQEGDKLMFKIESNNKLSMSIHSPPNHPPPVGFSPGRFPPLLHDLPNDQIVLNQKTTMNAAVRTAIQKVWNASSIDGHVYVCRLLVSPTKGNFLIFNKNYTHLIPDKHANIAMRFIGSDLILPGAIQTYGDGNARMTKEWPMYAKQHHLTFGEIFACKIQRGPAVWEFVGCCARHE